MAGLVEVLGWKVHSVRSGYLDDAVMVATLGERFRLHGIRDGGQKTRATEILNHASILSMTGHKYNSDRHWIWRDYSCHGLGLLEGPWKLLLDMGRHLLERTSPSNTRE